MGEIRPKKLTLSRETVRDLTSEDMVNVAAGVDKSINRGCLTKTIFPCICETAACTQTCAA